MPKRTSPKNKKQKKTSTSKAATVKAKNTELKEALPKNDKVVIDQAQQFSAAGAKSTKSTLKSEGFWSKEENRNKVYAVAFGAISIAITIAIAFVWIPQVVKNTDDYKAIQERDRIAKEDKEKAEKQAQEAVERAKLIEKENAELKFENRSVTMATSFGDLVIDVRHDTAPATAENFLRLVYRGFYNDQKIHRMVETDGFNVIQGGQANDGQSSEAALGGTVKDELWEVKPDFQSDEQQNYTLTNEPKLKQPALARDFDAQQGTIVYPKGLILMAKTSQADSATTQFFITLTDTVLPAEYTAFGSIRSDSFGVLDKILNDNDPQASESATEGYKDGAPEKEISYTIKLND